MLGLGAGRCIRQMTGPVTYLPGWTQARHHRRHLAGEMMSLVDSKKTLGPELALLTPPPVNPRRG